jgi:hypothetical protein
VRNEELLQVAEHARRMAYRVRHLEPGRADSEQLARAWERLGEAAFALEALCARRFAFDPPRKSLSWIPAGGLGPEPARPRTAPV